ncbi:MAG TPA: MFS transporter, partial [Roseiflexaceae bacterium]|nr:MFS transporter [Roseiflexaceae bacterium]
CGAALIMPLAVTQLSVAFPPELRGKAMGIFSGVTGLAVLAGPTLGGAIAGGLAWQWIFWLNVPLGLLLVPLVFRRIEESFGPRSALDIGGLLLITGAALGLVWGLVRGNQAGWGSLEVVGTLTAGVVLALAFVGWERRESAPMLPMRFFRSRAFSAGNAAGFLFFASLYGSGFFLAQFLQTTLGYGPLGAGLRLLPWTATLFVSAPLAGALINLLGERALMVGALLLQAVAMAWIGLIARPGLAYVELIAPLIIAGFGAAAIPTGQNAVVSSVAMSDIGKASGAFNMLRQLGAAFGVAMLAAVFATVGSFGSAQAFSDGFAPAMGASAALSFAGAVAGLWLPSRREKAVAPATAKA